LKPTESSKWPNENWEAPRDLQMWLKDNMDLPFQPANFKKDLPSIEKSNAQMSTVLSRVFDEKTHKAPPKPSKESITTIKFGANDDDEDFGTPVAETEPEVKTKPKTKRRRRKKDQKNSAITPLPDTDWKSFKKHWRIFLKGYDTMLTGKAGRKSLLARINKYKRQIGNNDIKIKTKLKGLRKSVLESTDGNIVALSSFQTFESFIKKRVRAMKKES